MSVYLRVLVVLCATLFVGGTSTLHLFDGVRVAVTCTGTELYRPTWIINGVPLLIGTAKENGIEGKDGLSDSGSLYYTIHIDIALTHDNYTLKCRVGSDNVYSTTLKIHAQFPSPNNINISHISSGVHFELSPPLLFDVDPNESVVIDVYPDITHYTVYITNLNTAQEMVYETADNSTEFTLTGLPGEDLNECTEYVFEVAAVNARAGEGETSEPRHRCKFIPRNCSNVSLTLHGSDTAHSSDAAQPAPTLISSILSDTEENCQHWKAVAIAGLSTAGVMLVIVATCALLLCILLLYTLKIHKRLAAKADVVDLNINSAYGSAKPRAMAQRSTTATPTVPPVYEELSGVQ